MIKLGKFEEANCLDNRLENFYEKHTKLCHVNFTFKILINICLKYIFESKRGD